MPTSATGRWAERLLERFHEAAKDHPLLSHVAIRSDAPEWPFHSIGGRRAVPGLTPNTVSVELAQGEDMPIPLEPHWLWVRGRLYQGHYLFRRWSYGRLHEGEEGVRLLRLLNEEAAALTCPAPQGPEPSALPSEIREIDAWMSKAYEDLAPVARTSRDLEILQLPGNVFSAIARVVESLVPDAPQTEPVAEALPVAAPTIQPEKPSFPTSDDCLVPPNIVRWEEDTEVQQRLWHLLGVLLKSSKPSVPFNDIEEVLYPGKDRNPKRLQNDISSLNDALTAINWPVTYSTKSGHVIIEPHTPS